MELLDFRQERFHREFLTFNVHTCEYAKTDFSQNVDDFLALGTFGLITPQFITAMTAAKTPQRSYMRYINPNQALNIPKTNIPDNIAYKMLNLAQMQEQLLRMTVLGDPILEAGRTITNNVPEAMQDVSSGTLDPQYSGRWLISKVEHKFNMPNDKPRYVCNMEALKGMYQE